MPEPPQLAPLDVEEQQLYSELLPGDRAAHPISKGPPCHPAEETHFGRLYPGSYFFGHDPKFMTFRLSSLFTTTDRYNDLPQNTMSDMVECLLQVHKTHVDWLGKLP